MTTLEKKLKLYTRHIFKSAPDSDQFIVLAHHGQEFTQLLLDGLSEVCNTPLGNNIAMLEFQHSGDEAQTIHYHGKLVGLIYDHRNDGNFVRRYYFVVRRAVNELISQATNEKDQINEDEEVFIERVHQIAIHMANGNSNIPLYLYQRNALDSTQRITKLTWQDQIIGLILHTDEGNYSFICGTGLKKARKRQFGEVSYGPLKK